MRNKARSGQLLGLVSVPTTAARAAACARRYSRSSIAGHKDTNLLLYQKHKTYNYVIKTQIYAFLLTLSLTLKKNKTLSFTEIIIDRSGCEGNLYVFLRMYHHLTYRTYRTQKN